MVPFEPSIPRQPGAVGDNRRAGWTEFRSGTVSLSLASVFNAGEAIDAGWAVDGANLAVFSGPQSGPGPIRVDAKVAVRDVGATLHRLTYQITALGVAPTQAGPRDAQPR